MKKAILTLACLAAFSSSALAAKLDVTFELPEFDMKDYNKPYVAIWAESSEQNKTLLLWHLTRRKNDKWLPDIRRWWRKVGRYGEKDLDGVTGATKGPGNYRVQLDTGNLENFTLMVEVVREDGGRSLVKQAINTNSKKSYSISADREIGDISITVAE